jgi:23S rRNA pseudouridine2605 synthase
MRVNMKNSNAASSGALSSADSKLVRLQKILADAGVASRRAAEELILDGRVYVNGNQIVTLGSKFDPEKIELEVDGESIDLDQSKAYLMFYKPAGVLSAMSDSEGRENLGDYFSKKGKFSQLIRRGNERFFHVGRLDLESEGLLLLTNDGEMAHRATHPSYGVEKKYLVLVHGEFSVSEIEKWKKGVELEDGFIRVSEANLWRSINNRDHWVSITIHEGRYHIIRRLCESSGLRVDRLIRTDFGPISIGDLKEGRYRHLTTGEIDNLFTVLKLSQ